MPETRPRLRARKIQKCVRALATIETYLSEKLDADEISLTAGLLKPQPTEQQTKLLTPKQTSRTLGVSEKTLANWRCQGTQGLHHVKVGSRIFYRRADLHAFILNNSKQSTSHKGGNYA